MNIIELNGYMDLINQYCLLYYQYCLYSTASLILLNNVNVILIFCNIFDRFF